MGGMGVVGGMGNMGDMGFFLIPTNPISLKIPTTPTATKNATFGSHGVRTF